MPSVVKIFNNSVIFKTRSKRSVFLTPAVSLPPSVFVFSGFPYIGDKMSILSCQAVNQMQNHYPNKEHTNKGASYSKKKISQINLLMG